MAVIPEFMRRQGLDSGPTGPTASPEAFGAGVGRGLQQAGNAISDLAGVMQQDYQERAYLDGAAGAAELQSSVEQMAIEVDRNARPDASGYAKAVTDGFDAQAKAYLDRLDPQTRRRFEPRIAAMRGQIATNATVEELRRADAWRGATLSDIENKALIEISKSPASQADLVARYEADARASGLPAASVEGRIKIFRENAAAAAAGTAIKNDARAAATEGALAPAPGRLEGGTAGVDRFVDQIVGVESGGNPNAKNPNSSATGLGQFISSTWLDMVKRYRPDLHGSMSREEILAMRRDPDMSREMTRRYAEENAGKISAAGLPTTAGNIYLGHFLGPGGAIAVLQSAPDRPVSEVLPSGVISANRSILAGKTAGQVRAWAARKMGGTSSATGPTTADLEKRASKILDGVEFADLSYEARQHLIGGYVSTYSGAVSQMRAADVAQQKQEAEALDVARNNLFVGLHDGTAGPEDVAQARSTGLLTDVEQIEKADRLLRQREERVRQTARIDSGETLDPLSTEDRKAVNTYWNEDGAAPQRLAAGDGGEVARLAGLVSRTGIIPKDAAGAVSGMLRSDDPKKLTAAVAIIDQVTAANPEAASRGPGQGGLNEGDRKIYQAVHDLAPYLTAEELKTRIRRMRDPADRAFQEASDKTANAELKDVDDGTIIEHFDASWWSDPRISPDAVPGLRADFDALYREFRRAYDTPEAAQEAALRVLGTRWGVSQVAGGQVLMRNPPEKVLPPIDGTHDWLARQLEATVKSQMGEDAPADLSAVFLKATRETDVDVEAGRSPAYAIVVQRADGMYESPGRVRFDLDAARGGAGKAREQKREDFTKERAEQQDDRRTLEELNRDSSGGAIVPRDELFGDR